ncbi:hypothetical protein [Pseudomonas monteilii]|uniref:hypothetical protein n=1 Tax=Pseudomonas monteilii TaxID=76759 RepID=UPI0013CE9C5B
MKTWSVPNPYLSCAFLPVKACRNFSATVVGFGFSCRTPAFPFPNGLVICTHSSLASIAMKSSGNGVRHAVSGGHPNQPVAIENSRST